MKIATPLVLLAGLLLAACDESQPPISTDTGVDSQTLDVGVDAPLPDAPRPDQRLPDQKVPDQQPPDQQPPDAPVPDKAPTCTDGVKNGAETDVDCGGPCPKCPDKKGCNSGADCKNGVCAAGKCAEATCTDGVKNSAETDVDCGGGTCVACAASKNCAAATDCASGVCASGKCAAPTCTDTVKNGAETDVDCGGGSCGVCATGKACKGALDCASGVCSAGTCVAPSCTDTVKNGAETDVDCGGGSCAACTAGQSCSAAKDCASGVCTAGKCAAPSCTDTVKNGAETDVDCGGSCSACAAGKGCAAATDCASGVCTAGTCTAPSCTDTVKNGAETDVDCGGGACPGCAEGKACVKGTDCQYLECTGSVCKSTGKALQKEVLADKPSGYWPLDEASGKTATDHSGNKRHGTYSGTCQLGLQGKAGKAANFQGKCWVNFGYSLPSFMSSSVGTVTALIKLPAKWHKGTASYPSHSMPMVFSNNAWYMGASVGTFAGVSGVHFWNFYTGSKDDRVHMPAKAGTWAHVAWVHDKGKLHGYVNGVGKSVNTHGNTASMGKWIIGCCAGITNYYYPSLMQHVATYSTALSAARIQAQAKAVGLYP